MDLAAFERIHAGYFAAIRSGLDAPDADQYIGLLYDHQSGDEWYDFGFRYFGAVGTAGIAGAEGIVSGKEAGTGKVSGRSFLERLLFAVFEDEQNKETAERIKAGMDAFRRCSTFSQRVHRQISEQAFSYLGGRMSIYDEIQLYQLKERNAMGGQMPLCRQEEYSIGVVYTWPGSVSAEAELMMRIKRAAADAGIKVYPISGSGKLLNDKQLETEIYVEEDELQFVITMHYEDSKTLDAYYYHVLWNPPEIPLGTPYYDGKVVDNYLMNDDYLIYDEGGMSDHLRSILMNRPRDIDHASCLVGSFPGSAVKKPRMRKHPRLFYCGMNWERAMNRGGRHEGLFQLLDQTGRVCFYGPDKVDSWGGIRPWEGYRCYKGEIPFDGFSILDKISQCGICLVISSDIHRRAGAVTNRAYEACAAGAVIISDNNQFMEKHFKDAVLFINYNKENPKDTFRQIMDQYEWIVSHPKEALRLARRSQQIFLEKFAMDRQLLRVAENHGKRFAVIQKDLFAKSEEKLVLVTAVIHTRKPKAARRTARALLQNFTRQYYRNMKLVLVCDETVESILTDDVKKTDLRICICAKHLFDEKGSRRMTDGQALRSIQMNVPHDYYICMNENEVWFYDHITTLVRTFEDHADSWCAYSGVMYEDKDGFKCTASFQKIGASDIYFHNWGDGVVISGQFLFRQQVHALIPEYTLNCVDGMEYSLYLNLLYFKHHKTFAFSKRMTCRFLYEKQVGRQILSKDMQLKHIRGIVKYDLPENTMHTQEGDLARILSQMPLRSWFRHRLLRCRLRKVDPASRHGKRILRKYEQAYQTYAEFFQALL